MATTTPRDEELATRFHEKGVRISAAVTIQQPAPKLYNVWREFTQLPRFIEDLESVTRTGSEQTQWTVRGPADRPYSWNARIINDEPHHRLAWETDADAAVPNAGSITFNELPFQRGTEVKAVVNYIPPAGSAGNAAAKLLGKDPKVLLQRALFQFRQLMETGEIATSSGQPAGANSRRSDRPGESPRRTDSDLHDIPQAETQS